MTRRARLKNLVNFRDLGGVKTKDGHTVKKRRLLRSGELVGLCDEAASELLENHDLRLIVDLRSEGEVHNAPDDHFDGVRYKNVLLHKRNERPPVAPGEKEFRKLREVTQVIEYMKNAYENMVSNPFAIEGYSEFIRLAAENKEGALLFHCYAGKDRTGVAAALLYTLLGVSKEAVIYEYMLTNGQRKAENERILEKARQQGKDEAGLAVLKISYEVCPEYLERVYEIADEKSGSFLRYIMDNMGVTKADVAELKRNYLE